MKRKKLDPHNLYASELAPYLLVSERCVRIWCRKFGMPHSRTAGKHLRFSARAVVEWMTKRNMTVPRELRDLAERKAA